MRRERIAVISKHGNSWMVALPRTLMAEMNWRGGDHIALRRAGNTIVVVSIEDEIRKRFAADEVAASEAAKFEVKL